MTLRKNAPVAKTPHAKRSAKSPARETIELPDEATLTELGRRLKLSTTQVVHLRITLQHVHVLAHKLAHLGRIRYFFKVHTVHSSQLEVVLSHAREKAFIDTLTE